ncbi:hypothetical protein CC79DRAFT_1396547 [Sarocladium strictum]
MLYSMQRHELLRPLLPGLFFVLGGLTAIVALHFKPSFRPLFLLPALGLTALSISTISEISNSWIPQAQAFGMCLGLTSFYQLLFLPILLCNHDGRYGVFQPTKEAASASTTSYRTVSFQSFAEAYRQWNDPRKLPLRPVTKPKPQSSDKTLAFVLQCGLNMAIIYLVDHNIVQPLFENIMSQAMLVDFAPESESLLRRLPSMLEWGSTLDYEQLSVRVLTSLHWLWHDYQVIETCHSGLAILFVGVLRFDKPDEWPPLYGSILDASSVRGLWGKYWHRIMTTTYATYAKMFSRTICRVRAGSTLDKTLVAFGIFAISGAGHALVNWQRKEIALSRDMLFFLANFAAILFEISVAKVVQACMSRALYGAMVCSRQARVLGYCWVCCWLIWIVPRWEYPRIYNSWIEAVLG